jgi:hypothetical protein
MKQEWNGLYNGLYLEILIYLDNSYVWLNMFIIIFVRDTTGIKTMVSGEFQLIKFS